MDVPVMALAWGVLLAGILQLLFQIAPLAALKKIPIPRLDFNNPGQQKFLILILPAILAGGIAQINLLVDTIFASLLITGSPTWLYVSDRLIQFPLGIFAIAIGTVLLPTLAKSFAQEDLAAFRSQLEKAFKLIVFLSIPSVIGLVLFAQPLLGTIFQRGAFLWTDVEQSSLSLIAFAAGLPFFMAMKVLVPAFFARHDTKTPMLIALFSLILNIVLNYFLAFHLQYGHLGLALASSIASVLSVTLLCVLLSKQKLISFQILVSSFAAKILVASMALILFLLFMSDASSFEMLTQTQRIINLLLVLLASMAIYFGSSYLLGIKAKDFK